MPRLSIPRRRRGHRETPILVGLFWLVCTFGVGALTVVRDTKRAEKIGTTLDLGEKWTAFWHGYVWGMATFVAFLVALFIFFAIVFRLEDWRWKRGAKRKENP